MNLDQILNGARVLVDANIILYALQWQSQRSRTLLARCDARAVEGFITTIVTAEVSHRRMIDEARSKGLVDFGPARALRQRTDLVRQLQIYAEDVRDLLGGGLEFEAVRAEDFFVALELQKQHGLLTNDALNLAVARRLGINEIATADTDFDQIQGLIVYKPGDLMI